ncbi:hypothetical protein LI328DRAFT_151772 [Trichoderma asperelloides]|nr:hypothetical protein LI328DRAFT_151772 [Trichoderma asperelloides]
MGTHRPLLPKPENLEQLQHDVCTAPRSGSRSKASNTLTACDTCRQRKIKCDGRQPTCASCQTLRVSCSYFGAVRRRLRGAEADRDRTILRLLRTLPPEDAVKLLQTLRNDSSDTPRLISTPSEHNLLRGALGPTRNSLEFELTVRHPVSYPPLFPLKVSSLPLESLLRPSRTNVSSRISITIVFADDLGSASSTSDQRTLRVAAQYCPTRPLVEERLQELEMKNWSEVRITNDLAAHIISLYIETDYQTLPLFNLDLFLRDFLDNQRNFCSPLLVNSIFSWACQTYSAVDSQAYLLSLAFFAQAQSLIAEGPELVTLTTVSALQFLCIAAMGYGKDRLALQFLRQSVKIGTSMGLFGVVAEQKTASAWLGDHEDWIRAASYTAWGIFNWVSLIGLRYHCSEISSPPMIPMPGTLNIGPEAERLGAADASIHTQVFKACCELWVISRDVTRNYQHTGCEKPSEQQQEHSEHTIHRLLAWADALPLDLVRSDQSTHAVLMMHIYFHAIVTDVFRPFIHISPCPFRLRSFTTPGGTPKAIYSASISQLKRLLLHFRLSFKTASLSILSQTVLIYVSNAVIQESQHSNLPEWSFYLRLCLAALEDLYGSYRESWSVMQGLLSMALDRGAIMPGEADRISQEMIELGRHHGATNDVDTRSMIDLDLAVIDPTAARVTCLAGKFSERMLPT